MPIPNYQLDDRSFDDLVSELLARIPGHTPEWTNPRLGDPGRTLIELFAWLGDTLLYRVNLLPERQRLAFLRLLNIPLRPARPAEGMVVIEPASERLLRMVPVPLQTTVKGPLPFETRGEISVLPLQGKVYVRRVPTRDERAALGEVVRGLHTVYNVKDGTPYISTPLFVDGQLPEGFDIARQTVDHSLWIALMSPSAEPEVVRNVRLAMTRDQNGSRLLNVGIVPRLKLPRFDEQVGKVPAARNLWSWEITSGRKGRDNIPEYLSLTVVHDGSEGFSRQGVVRLELPDSDDMGVPTEKLTTAGLGNRPPRIDDPDEAGRIISWLRLRPLRRVASFALTWAGINATTIDQRTTLENIIAGSGSGMSDQTVQLPGGSVDAGSLILHVEESGRFVPWRMVDELATASRNDPVFRLDEEAGTVTFGDGVRGKVPAEGARIRVVTMRCGGGAAGNLSPGNIGTIAIAGLKVSQPVATGGGADAERVDEAEKRIPAFLKHGDRAVTEEDYHRIALDTPGVELARVEVIPRFKPHQRRFDVPGVVTVLVIPKVPLRLPPNPAPDRVMLERVHEYLDARRPMATELYVIGVDYRPLGITAAVTVQDGYPRDEVLRQVRETVRTFLWPLAPGGADAAGWGLGETVSSQELEVVVARVSGVRTVAGVNLFTRKGAELPWEILPFEGGQERQRFRMERWQLPELLSVVVTEGEQPLREMALDDGAAATGSGPGAGSAVAIPVAPEVC